MVAMRQRQALNLSGVNNGRARHPKGESHVRAKLTEQQVKEIKLLLKYSNKYTEIGRRYNVSQRAIMHINSGTNWKHIEG